MTRFVPAGSKTPPPQALSGFPKLRVLLFGVRIPKPENLATPAEAGLEYETARFKARDGIELEAWSIPREDPRAVILMFHGYATSKTVMISRAKAAHELGCAAVLVDHRGSGGSEGRTTTIGWREADDVAAAFVWAKANYPETPVVLLGVSMGGAAVLRAVSVHNLPADGIVVESVFGRMLGTVRARFRLMNLPPFPTAETLLFWGSVQAGFNGFAHSPEKYARRADMPALVIQGETDVFVSMDEARAIFDALPGPKNLLVIPDCGHDGLIEKDPDEWRSAVEDLLSRLDKEAARR